MDETNSHDYESVIKVLSETLWDGIVDPARLNKWLLNFDLTGREQALHLLSQFVFVGFREMRELMRALYRDFVRYPMIRAARAENAGSFDSDIVEPAVARMLSRTRFVGIGNPSESGTHLLYYFRQENSLPRDLFINAHRIFTRDGAARDGASSVRLRAKDIDNYIFIDDLCGSGTQARQYSRDIVDELRLLNPNCTVGYLCLLATETGLANVSANTSFTSVQALFRLDDSFRCFSANSRYYLDSEAPERIAAEATMAAHGESLWPGHPLGYRDGQLLVGFAHNIPDNTLPIFWADADGWNPLFKRYQKL